MAEVHGGAYIAIGLFLTVASLIFNIQDGSYKFMLFLLVGAGMIVWGIIKLTGSRRKEPKAVIKHNPSHYDPKQQYIKYCSSCGTALHGFQQFCHMCGSKIFHRR